MSVAVLRIRVQISMVKMVAVELKMEVSDETRADIITAIINPFRPVGISCNENQIVCNAFRFVLLTNAKRCHEHHLYQLTLNS